MPDTLINPPVARAAAEAPHSLWRDADFMKLWTGQVISLMGSAFSGLAVALLAALTLGATPAQMGLLMAAGSGPSRLIGLFAGVWVDRYRRRTFLIAGDVGRALLLATIPIAALLGVLSMLQLYAVSFLAGVLTVFFDVASQSYLPAIIDRRQLVQGNSKLGLSSSITAVAGPSLAGVVIQAITAPFAVALDALSFLASAGLVLLIRRREERAPVAPASVFSGLPEGLRDGLHIVFDDGRLRALAGCLATSNLASNVFLALYMPTARASWGSMRRRWGWCTASGRSGRRWELSARPGRRRASVLGGRSWAERSWARWRCCRPSLRRPGWPCRC